MAIQSALTELSTLLGDRFTRSKAELDLHGRSESHFPPTPPDAVLYPADTGEVQAILRICSAQGCPVVAWGAGTSLEGHGLAIRGGVCVDFSRMNRVIEVNAADMDVRVQPDITREDLNRELRATGLFFPVDPGANATLGGMAATRASGTTAVRYGTMRQNVLALEAVLADGRVIRTGSRARKSSAGYDLTALLVGSEGTLGLITELTLKLHGIPEATSAAVCAFPDIAASPIPGPILGHVGDGNLHAVLLVKDEPEMKVARALAHRMAERALRLGGTITGEHGIGIGKLDHMEAEHGAAWDVMGDIKRALDPRGTLNPGKTVRQGSI